MQVPASSQARRHPLTLTTSDSLALDVLFMKKYLVGSFKVLDFALQLCCTYIRHVILCCSVTCSWLLILILQILKGEKQ